MYPLQAPPAHQDQSQLGSGRLLVGITFQLSSAAASPPSRPGRERRANWAAELSGGLVGANSGSPIFCLPVSTTPRFGGPCMGRGGGGTPEAGTGSCVSMNCPGLGPASVGARISWTSSGRSLKLHSLSFLVRELGVRTSAFLGVGSTQ